MTIKNARTILVTMCGEENIEEKPMKKINNFFRSEYVLYGNCTQFVCFDFDKEGRILNVRHNNIINRTLEFSHYFHLTQKTWSQNHVFLFCP